MEIEKTKNLCEKRTLVFSGGGTKGLVLLGSLIYIGEIQGDGYFTKVIKRYVGTSVGAMISLLLCIGYAPLEIYNELAEKDFNQLTDFQTIFHCFKKGMFSLDSGKKLFGYFEDLVSKKIDKDTTFIQLYEKTNIELSIVSCCISNYPDKTTCILNHLTSPDLKIITAVKMSSSIPFIFPPVEYNGKAFIDGGVSMNYPIGIFDPEDNSILGFYLDSTYASSGVNSNPLENSNSNSNEIQTETYELKKYTMGIFNIVFNSNIDILLKTYGHNTIFLSGIQKDTVKTTKIPTREQKEQLKDQGYKMALGLF